jgi:hypothetical protein
MTATPKRRPPAAKALEIKSMVEMSRWALLDAVVMLHELYEALAVDEGSTADSRGVFDPEPNHEDYIPEGDEG